MHLTLSEVFPVWASLTEPEREALSRAATKRAVEKGAILHNGAADCVGLFLICAGRLRAYILSEEGKELTLYRLFERDMCLFSASCMLSGIQFDIIIEAEKGAEIWVIPAETYKNLMAQNAAVANYTNQLMASRFSEVMWLIEQVMWKRMDARLAAFLLEESALEDADALAITHERIASHMGTAREVVTRLLRYFQAEGMVTLSRGAIQLTNRAKLQALAG